MLPEQGWPQLWELLCWPMATALPSHPLLLPQEWAAGKSDQPRSSRKRDQGSGGAWWIWTALELLVDYLLSSTCCQPK